MRNALLLSILCVFIALVYAVYWRWVLPNHDSSWLLTAAQRLLDGGRFYHEIFEVNPPLILLLIAPGVWISALLSIDVYSGYLLWVLFLIAMSTVLARRSLVWLTDSSGLSADIVTLGYAAILVFFPAYDFGQREHLLVILSTPALLWFAAQSAGMPRPSSRFSFLVVVAASLGILIKPYFLILPVAYLIAKIVAQRSWRAVIDTHLFLFAAIGASYAVLVVLAFPEWLTVARLATALYDAYENSLIVVLWWLRVEILTLPVAWILAERLPISPRTRSLTRHLALVALIFLLAVVIQRKGWTYHYLPVTLYNAMILAILLLQVSRSRISGRMTRMTATAAVFAVCAPIILFMQPAARLPDWARSGIVNSEFMALTREVAGGRSLLAFDTSVGPALSAVTVAKARWASRQSSQWLIPGIIGMAKETARERAKVAKYRKIATSMVTEDLNRYRPAAVAVRNNDRMQSVGTRFDFVAYFSADPRFRAAWSKYTLHKRIRGWDFYTRITQR